MKNIPFFLLIFLLFTACTDESSGIVKEITALEAEVEANATGENTKALVEKYQEYVAQNPDKNEEAASYLNKAAELEIKLNHFSAAINILKTAIRDHFNSTSTPANALLLASIYDKRQKNAVGATAMYQTFVEAFPNHEESANLKATYANEPSLDDKIVDFGNRLMNDSTNRIDYRVANDFIGICEVHALLLPNNPKSGDYLHKAGETARSLRSFPRALEIYDWITNNFPNHPKAPQALFLKAFTYDNDIKDLEKARELYQEFLTKYPEDDFADDTQFLLDNLGKDDEEIIQSFGN